MTRATTIFRRMYGAGPVHLLGLTACFAIAVIAAAGWLNRSSDTLHVLLWFAGAIVAHDLVLLPAYSLLDRLARRRDSLRALTTSSEGSTARGLSEGPAALSQGPAALSQGPAASPGSPALSEGPARRPSEGAARRPPEVPVSTPGWVFLRIPLLLSGLLMLVFGAEILRLGSSTYQLASGKTQDLYLVRFLVTCVVLFAISGAAYLLSRLRRRRANEGDPSPDPPPSAQST